MEETKEIVDYLEGKFKSLKKELLKLNDKSEVENHLKKRMHYFNK